MLAEIGVEKDLSKYWNMKLNKSQVCLYIFYKLLKGQRVNAREISDMFSITTVSFARDIQEIRAFLANIFSTYELVYIKKEDSYVLYKYEERKDFIN